MKLENKGINQLKKEFDKIFSWYIRLRDAKTMSDGQLYGVCCTCGKSIPVFVQGKYKMIRNCKWQNGHYITRNSSPLRFNEKNCNGQCEACNVWNKGEIRKYALFLETKFGFGILQELNELKKETIKFTKSGILDKIKYYESKIKELENEKL